MLIKKPAEFRYSEITPKDVYLNRRTFLTGAAVTAAVAAASGPVARWFSPPSVSAQGKGPKLAFASKNPFSTSEPQTPFEDVTTYNNYYEFGTAKNQPSVLAKNFKTTPWTVSVEGEIAKP